MGNQHSLALRQDETFGRHGCVSRSTRVCSAHCIWRRAISGLIRQPVDGRMTTVRWRMAWHGFLTASAW
jgi:hypothetical protein